MAISVGVGPATGALATTLTRLDLAAGVVSFDLSCTSDVYVVMDDSLDDASALGATYFRVPAGTIGAIPRVGKRILLAAASGTPTVTLLGWPV